ncbi:Predicted arabinose efflux permease, MFS family [Amycolatopsis lurida]|uniref:Major facilitator transporter n=1 Tax=Amycolatopsis lurida NRRL 2430 TaxID=1460371 RepID=A0A2P2FYU8_AMYLU|nr:major facilitator transporter [Amycolatopsis lurida NRRL 2430]SEB32215.1 Predicted arabinose efflux permease, MFS family [Amycolatopsis lurida]
MSLFGHRDYRHLFGAQLVALFGTGLTTVALGLLAYDLAGAGAGAVLGTALAIKMITYVTVAPLAGAYADRVPRRLFLVSLDAVRALVVLALPFVDQVWQVYVLIVVLQSASASFTPTFQAVLPDILPDERDYTKALSLSQLASTMENLLSPLLAAAVLSLVSFSWLFTGTSIGFAASAALVLSTRIPEATRSHRGGIRDRTLAGIKIFTATPRLRGTLGLAVTVAAVGSVVMVNTVNYVQDTLGRPPTDVALLLAGNGIGTILGALLFPRALDRIPERTVMLTGGGTLLAGMTGAIALSTAETGSWRWGAALTVWAIIGLGTGLVLTPVGRVLRRSSHPGDRPAIFAAHFSLSHACWLLAYPLAGWLATTAGFTTTWLSLGALALLGLAVAIRTWPRRDPLLLEHTHHGPVDPAHLADAVRTDDGTWRHSHEFVIDQNHHRWPVDVRH